MLRLAYGFLLIVGCEAGCTMNGGSCKYWSYAKTAAGGTADNCGTAVAKSCGPEFWNAVEASASVCTATTTSQQSPIAANFKLAQPSPTTSSLTLSSVVHAADTPCPSASFNVNPRTVEVQIPGICQQQFSASWTSNGVTKKYQLQSYHFHSPSEHTVDGMYYEMEAQHVHQASDASILIIAVFLRADAQLKAKCAAVAHKHISCERANFFNAVLLGGRTETALLAQVKALAGPPAEASASVAATTVSFDPYKKFIPPMTTHFYYYKGSFTTPPCTEGVTWILNPIPVLVFEDSVHLYKKITQAYPNNQLAAVINTNNRAIQPMNGRKLYYAGNPAVGSTTPRPGVPTLTPGASSTPAVSTTPKAGSRLYGKHKGMANSVQSSSMLWLGAGAFLGVITLAVVRAVRSRTLAASAGSIREVTSEDVCEQGSTESLLE